MIAGRLPRLVAGLGFVVLLAGCGSQSGASPDAQASVDFKAEQVDGEAFDGSSLEGRDAVLWFWAPWCTECRGEAPDVAEAQAEYADDVSFVGVAGLGPVSDMKAFVSDYQVEAFPHIADTDGSVWKRFGVVRQPAFAFIDDDGTVEVEIGVLGAEELDRRLADLTAD